MHRGIVIIIVFAAVLQSLVSAIGWHTMDNLDNASDALFHLAAEQNYTRRCSECCNADNRLEMLSCMQNLRSCQCRAERWDTARNNLPLVLSLDDEGRTDEEILQLMWSGPQR